MAKTTGELLAEMGVLVQALDEAMEYFVRTCEDVEATGDEEAAANADYEATEAALARWLDTDSPGKMLAIEADSRQCKGWVAMAKDEARRHTARSKAFGARIERNAGNLVRLMQAQRELNGSDKMLLPGGRTATLRSKVSAAVEVTDIDALPPGCIVRTVAANKAAIKAALKLGDVNGARMVETRRESVSFKG